MSPSQFQTLLNRFDKFEERFDTRLRLVERTVYTFVGGVTVIALLVSANVINIG